MILLPSISSADSLRYLQASGLALGIALFWFLVVRPFVVYGAAWLRSCAEQRRLQARLEGGNSMADAQYQVAPLAEVSPFFTADIREEKISPAAVAADDLPVWQQLGKADAAVVAAWADKEHPQVVAFVLSKMGPAEGAAILSLCETNFALQILLRLAMMGYVQKEMSQIVEASIQREVLAVVACGDEQDGAAKVAAMLNHLSRPVAESYLKFLAVHDKDVADRVRMQLFAFDDIEKIGQEGIKALLQVADRKRLAVALKGAADGLRLLFVREMPAAVAETFMRDVHGMGPVTMRDVHAAQTEMVIMLRELIAKGKIAWQ